jgi:ankyrin repeat protein
LGWAVLEGAPDATVSRLIERTKWIISVDGSEATKKEVFAELNRALLLALEHPGAVRLLLEAGASADSEEPYGKTALMYAAQFDLLDTARLLLERGAKINSATRDMTSDDDRYCDSPEIAYRTALHYAAANASLPMIRMLVERGANPAATLDDKRAPADMIAANARLSPAEREAALALLRR